MIGKIFFSVLFFDVFFICFVHSNNFIANQESLISYSNIDDVVMVASPGRSGSTLLEASLLSQVQNYRVLKTHILPPKCPYSGKILFIFSNPNRSAESVLHFSLINDKFTQLHFYHVESSDSSWLNSIGNSTQQTVSNNLLTYDALGCHRQLSEWLHLKTIPSTDSEYNSQIMAIKYENLWEEETICAIKKFLNLIDFKLPEKKERGYAELHPNEICFRNLYNLGTDDHPRYAAYDEARILWENAPAFQFLSLK